MKYLIKITWLAVLALMITSCQEELEVGGTQAEILSGDWIVKEYVITDGVIDLDDPYGPYTIQIYNTSFSQDSIWVDNIYDSGYMIKAGMLSENTFGVTAAKDYAEEHKGTIEVKEAKVVNNDSIIFRVVLYDEDGEVADDYYEAGHRYTGW